MALKGSAQMDLLSAMHVVGLQAIGLSGQDAGMLRSHRRAPVAVDGQMVDYGCVGDIDNADPALLRHLIGGGYVPVIAPFTVDATHQLLNTNADTVAAAIAVALGVEKLFFVVKAPGLLSNPDDPRSLLPLVDLAQVAELEAAGAIQGGMRPKIAAACTAKANDARKVEREVGKHMAAVAMQRRIGEVFDAVVTGASPKGTWVRLRTPLVEGRVERGEEGLDVGDRVRVRLVSTNPERGFIDFVRI